MNIKQKIKDIWTWIKSKIKHILIILGIGVCLAVGNEIINPPVIPPVIPSVVIQGQMISFPYTDDNSNENLIIRTDSKDYGAVMNGVIIYAMVENKSGANQSGSFQTYFPKSDLQTKSVSVMMTGDYQITVDDFATSSIISATSGKEVIQTTKIGNHKETRTGNYWQKISTLSNFTTANTATFLGLNSNLIKPKTNQLPDKRVATTFAKNSINYYKIEIQTPARLLNDEFYLEAIGANGGYGLLDPTLVIEDFNAMGDGTLSGTSSWTGDATMQVEPTVVYEGAKAISQTGGSGYPSVYKTGSQTPTGQQTWYWRNSDTTSRQYVFFYEGATQIDGIFTYNGNICITSDNTAILNSYAPNTWYELKFEWRISDGKVQFNARPATSTTWSTVVWRAPGGAMTNGIDKLQPASQASAAIHYWDYFAQDTYATPTASAVAPTINRSQVIE